MINIGNLNKREKAIFVFTALIVVLKLFFDIILTPYFGNIDALDKKVTSLKNKLIKARLLTTRKSAIEKNFQDLAPILKDEEGLPKQQQVSRVLAMLERLGNESGVNINDIKPRAIQQMEHYSEFAVELRLEAEAKEAADFIYRLQESKELLTIDKFELSLQSGDSPLLYGYLEIRKILP
ncbi:MAG: type 4a pilus biogenesis protein PilO [Candidatus Omnitrophota bacterium]